MKKIGLLILTISLPLILISCGKKNEAKTEKEKQLPLVKTMQVETVQFIDNYKIVGTVKPFESAKLSSEEGGLITYLAKDKGSSVSRGEVIVRLKKDVDIAAYEQALSQYNVAKENFSRAERLFNDNVTTEQNYTNAKLQLDVALKAVEFYETRLSKGYIVSPISGVVDAKYMNKGEMSAPGVPIISIVNISKVKVSAGIPERYLTNIKKGKKISITFDAIENETFEAVISYVSPVINPQSRTFEIEAVINNPNRILKPEMSANIELTAMTIDDAVVLDQDLITDDGENVYVFVLNGDTAVKRIIKIGGRNDGKVYIEEGLNPGDYLINVGFQGLNDGNKVKVIN